MSNTPLKPLRVAVIGCGHISKQYGDHLKRYPSHLELAGATDLDFPRAEAFCTEYGGKAYRNVEEMIQDPNVDLVINLTVHHAHFDLNIQAMRAGKHVFSEKPMALTFAQAQELVRVSEETGTRLGAAPTTFLGEGVQTAARFLESGRAGPVRVLYAEANWGQIETWISAPAPYYTVGPLLDVAVYAITAMAYLLGPAKRVHGYSTILKNPRFDKEGREFPVTAPDFTTGMIEFANGMVARITSSYYVNVKGQRHLRCLEFHGDAGSFSLGCFHDMNPACRFIPYGKPPVEVPLLRPTDIRMDRAVGLADMAEAIHGGRRHLACPHQAAHVVEIMEALQTSSDESRPVEITSTFERLPLMPWTEGLELQVPNE